MHGLKEGYQTMDLLATFFFSTVIISSIRATTQQEKLKQTLKATLIGASLLSLVYLGLSYVAAHWNILLENTKPEYYLGTLSINILGPYAGLVACVAVALACLTTAIALANVFSDYLHKVIFNKRVSYSLCLIATLILNYFISTLEFTGIMKFLAPILQIAYPALILLTLFNIANKLWGFRFIKAPIFAVFLLSLYKSLF